MLIFVLYFFFSMFFHLNFVETELFCIFPNGQKTPKETNKKKIYKINQQQAMCSAWFQGNNLSDCGKKSCVEREHR